MSKTIARALGRVSLSLIALALILISTPRVGSAAPRERRFAFEYKATVKDMPLSQI